MATILGITAAMAALVGLAAWTYRQAARLSRFFLAAATSYLLFDEEGAGLAALLAATTAVGASRGKMLAILAAVAQAPDSLVLLFLSADRSGRSPLRAKPISEAAVLVRERAATLATAIAGYEGTFLNLRESLARTAPAYERAIGGWSRVDSSVFSDLDQGHDGRCQQVLQLNRVRARRALVGSLTTRCARRPLMLTLSGRG